MPAAVDELDGDLIDTASRVCHRAAQDEDAFWRRHFWQEHYYRPDLDFEDYAPAYCVGYIGFAQYGGEFSDAQRSLCANWERIKCGSRLSLEEALTAIKAAWDRRALSPNGRPTVAAATSMPA